MKELRAILFPTEHMTDNPIGEMQERLSEARRYHPLVYRIWQTAEAEAREHRYRLHSGRYIWLAFELLKRNVTLEELLLRHAQRQINPIMMVNPVCTRNHRDRIWTKWERFKYRWSQPWV